MANSSMIDRISCLPLPVLHHVLSFLPTLCMVRTSVLSKHWRSIWCSAPTLSFEFTDILSYKRPDDVSKFVDLALLLRDGSDIQNLELHTPPINRVGLWILYAIRHNLQALDMYVYDSVYSDANWKFPLNIFACESLRELKLQYKQRINLPSSIWLPALKTLHLMGVIVADSQLVDVVLVASPSLEILILESCDFQCSLLPISSIQLKKLKLSGPSCPSVVISTPNIISLYLDVWQESPTNISINGDLLCLRDAVISIPGICPESATRLLSVVKNVRSLSLTPLSPFVAEFHILSGFGETFVDLKSLKIDSLFSDAELVWINNILKLSPGIESVYLTNSQVKDDSNAARLCNSDKMWSKYELCHLKIMELHGFKGSMNELKMVKFLFENAAILDQILIMYVTPQDGTSVKNKEMLKIGRELLTYSRASASVGILFAQTL